VRSIDRPIPFRIGRWAIDLTGPLHYGYLGVHLFLLLSGFCLTYPLARRAGVSREWRTAGLRVELGSFFRRRAWRILPPYYAALALCVAVPLGLHPRSPDARVSAGNVLAHVLMVYNLFPRWSGTINGDFWSLALEWQLYLIFPLLLWSIRRWGLGPMLAGALALTLGFRTWVWLEQEPAALFWCRLLPGRWFEFTLGMSAALLLGRHGPVWATERAGRWMVGFGLLAALGLWVTQRWSPNAPATDAIWGGAFFCLLLAAAGWPEKGGVRSLAPWSWRPLERLGAFSYSVYLIHDRVLRTASGLLGSRLGSPVRTLVFFELVMLPLLVVLGWLFYRLVEARFIGRGKPLAPAFAPGGPAPARPTELRLHPREQAAENGTADRELAPL
jgi:peptidoglycan/LPS O-acetylase OafA/YrhL